MKMDEPGCTLVPTACSRTMTEVVVVFWHLSRVCIFTFRETMQLYSQRPCLDEVDVVDS